MEKLVLLLGERPAYLTIDGRRGFRKMLERQGTGILDAYRRGRTDEPEPRPLNRDDGLEAQMVQLRQRLDEPARADDDAIAELIRLNDLRTDIGRAGEVLRSRGESPWQVEQFGDAPPAPPEATTRVEQRLAGVDPSSLDRAALLAATQMHPVGAFATGTLMEPLDRSLPGLSHQRSMVQVSDLATMSTTPPGLGAAMASALEGYDLAHLVGPGFGDELSEGIMFAPAHFNRRTQNQGIERLIRAFREAGHDVEASIEVRGTLHAIPKADGSVTYISVLTEVHYDIDHPSLGDLHISYDVGPPSQITFSNIPGLTLDGYQPPPG